MSKYSQKPTNKDKWSASKAGNGSLGDTSVQRWINHPAATSRFTGMSKNIERIEAVIIPGYKIRG